MDNQQFDALTRRLGSITNRRSLLGAFATALLGSSALPESVLACKKVGKKCDKNKDCCDGARCKNGKCKCKSGFSKCDKKCYDLDKDRQNCGSCGNACVPPDECCDGECNLTCVI